MNDVSYIEKNVKDSIINDLQDIALYHSRKRKIKNAGHFSTPRQVFCYIDYLGGIAFGGRSTKRAVRFLQEYFPKNYKNFAELLYSMWRHGTIHRYKPECFFGKYNGIGKINIVWLSNNSTNKKNRKEHMKIYAMEGYRHNLHLVVNTCQLVDDLLSSIDKLTKKMRMDARFKDECEERLSKMGTIQEYKKIENKNCRKAVEKQIKLADNKCAGFIDRQGNVIERFKIKNT